MKFSIVFVSSFASLAVAQTLTSSAQPPISSADIPKCVFECGLKASQAIGCTTDVLNTCCICDKGFLPAVEPCVHSTCNNTDHMFAMRLWETICGPIPTGTVMPTNSLPSTCSAHATSTSLQAPGGTASTAGASASASATPSSTGSSNAAMSALNVDFKATGVWTIVLAGGAAIAQVML
ncbi:hypothetical protein FRC08_011547 [Ceratobasidium sp. 394]|nr:hypothetical protein FRC08_011547 [Ceratobasidium sp. 394]